jgi:hypothetical protein
MSAPLLDREEYIEQAYFFRVYRERIEENTPAQEVLAQLREEVLATTKLPLAIDFLAGELHLKGRIGEAMARLPHYFTPFQSFVMTRAEDDESRFDVRLALQILEREADYMTQEPHAAGLFVYQFECVSRNRLGYEAGMSAVAADPLYDAGWRDWILKIRRQLGTVDFSDLIYMRSQFRIEEIRRRNNDPAYEPSFPILFGSQEGRIARANKGKDPLYMFAALQRQLGYPAIPRPAPPRTTPLFDPPVDMRFQRLEARLQLLEQESKTGIDISKLYKQGEFGAGEMN